MLNTILTKMKSFAKDETGASAIEYAVIAAIVVVALVVAFGASGISVSSIFTGMFTDVTTATGG
ncbi:Flp pilus assembly protein, pilin Flp [Spongiibacter sp. IMCC21906]|uniref:Flp family type IVb pilin n=1 Tax=Spongiibacter sp. IMCC21906 TaxID=1620392 RepID=UPI00062E0017|nr:Flp family type IVb pilin [Spongiibacter sp. IMCC21906]AKH69592.1 Flp pilus assembly protein, pilin Flp [Spongiibacter sp. IMCC21906]